MRAGVTWHHLDLPEGSAQAGNTVTIDFWMPRQWTLLEVQVSATTPNTVGTHTLTMLNGVAGPSVLVGASFDLTTLAARTPTDLALSGTQTNLEFRELNLLVIQIASNNAGFDGSGIFLGLLAQEV